MKYDLVLIDASSWLYRAYFAFPPLSTSDGTPTGALVGCLQTLVAQIQNGALRDAKRVLAAFDYSGPTFRHKIASTYKANRTRKSPDLYPQFALAQEAFAAFGIHTLAEPGVEADDVIAAYATIAARAGLNVAIMSTDKDLTQFVGAGLLRGGETVMIDAMGTNRGAVVNALAVQNRWGVPPSKMASLLALTGDDTDGVPGIDGVGPKTAARLLANYRDLEDLLAHIDDLPDQKDRLRLTMNVKTVRDAYRLIRLPSPDCPMVANLPLDVMGFDASQIDVDKVLAFMDRYEIKKLRDEVAERWAGASVPGRELI